MVSTDIVSGPNANPHLFLQGSDGQLGKKPAGAVA